MSEDVVTYTRLFAIWYKITSLASAHKGHPIHAFGHGDHTVCCVNGSHSS